MSTQVGGSGHDGGLVKVVNGGIYLVGSSSGNNYPVTDGSVNHGSTDMVITKLDANGTVIFSKYIGGSGYDAATIMERSGGVIYICGQSQGPGIGLPMVATCWLQRSGNYPTRYLWKYFIFNVYGGLSK